MSIEGKLKKFGKTFKTAKKRAAEEGGFGSELPDGRYKARLQSCSLGESKSSGVLQVAFGFVVTAGEAKGEHVNKYARCESEDDQVWLLRDLKRFGLSLDDMEDLPEVVKLLDEAKPELVISLKTKDSGQFAYIDKVTSEIDAGDFANDEEGDDDDEDEDDEDGDDEDEADEKDEDKGSDDDDDDEDSGDEVKIEKGMTVEFEYKGKTRVGKVLKVQDNGLVKVETDKGMSVVKLEELSLVEGDEDEDEDDEDEAEEEEKPAKSKVKKAER